MQKLPIIFGKRCCFFCVAFLICGLLLTACTPNAPNQTLSVATVSEPEHSDRTEPSAPEESEQATENVQELEDAAYSSLVSLRQGMIDTPQCFAVAYFGYALPDGSTPADPYAVMAGAAPQLCDNLPFLQQIPKENILGTDGNLFCVVPADQNATVSVNWCPWDEATRTYAEATVLYRSETGAPFLLMTDNTAWCLETEVIITDSDGKVTTWYPFIGEDNRIAPLCDENGVNLYCDFSHYDRLNYENLVGGAPIEMVGTWALRWTEAEGDRVEAGPGGGNVEITTDGMDSYRISYVSSDFPEHNFFDRELRISPGELYSDCGNNQWIAEVCTANDEPMAYAVTLLHDGMLLMQYRWEMDGMPMVSYGWYAQTD